MTDPAGAAGFLDQLAPKLAAIGAQASDLDEAACFPEAALDTLRDAGVLAAPLPRAMGGMGIGTDPTFANATFAMLRAIGGASLSLGRVFEGHLNAVRLILHYGTVEQAERVADDLHGGHLYGLWITDAPGRAVRLDGGTLHGAKSPASAAAHATRALITLEHPGRGERMAMVRVEPGAAIDGAKLALQGMRSTGTGAVGLDGLRLDEADLVGVPGDYMRQPEISLGAWRTLAVIMGGFDALVNAARADLVRRGRHADPHQLARMGQLAIAHETARLWLAQAAIAAETAAGDGEAAANYVKLARIAVETACLDAIRLVQRALGMSAFVQPHPVERLARDLGTYLRQPALDMVLDEAALYYATQQL